MKPLLGWDATPDQTGPPRPLLLHQHDVEAEVVRVEGGRVPTGAAPDYDDVCQVRPFVSGELSLVSRLVSLRKPMQTRVLLIASAILAVIILVAGAFWLFRLLA
jgi:hypothetical protein